MLRYPQLSHQPPISRTLQYKKITKPLLERKRRARINRCLEELKDLMVGALEAEGENINKLEKADILELTVRHLHRITKPHDPTEEVQRFQAGFTQCASEACGFLLSLPGLDARVGKRLVEHLGRRISQSLESNPSILPYGNLMDHPSVSTVGRCDIKPSIVSPRDCGSSYVDTTRPSGYESPTSMYLDSSVKGSIMAKLSKTQTEDSILPNRNLHDYPYRYFDNDYSRKNLPDIHSEEHDTNSSCSNNKVPPKLTKPSSTCSSSVSNPEVSSIKLVCPQPTRPLVLQVPSLPDGTSMPASPATSTSSISDINCRLDTLAVSANQTSSGSLGSPDSEDSMWRPW